MVKRGHREPEAVRNPSARIPRIAGTSRGAGIGAETPLRDEAVAEIPVTPRTTEPELIVRVGVLIEARPPKAHALVRLMVQAQMLKRPVKAGASSARVVGRRPVLGRGKISITVAPSSPVPAVVTASVVRPGVTRGPRRARVGVELRLRVPDTRQTFRVPRVAHLVQGETVVQTVVTGRQPTPDTDDANGACVRAGLDLVPRVAYQIHATRPGLGTLQMAGSGHVRPLHEVRVQPRVLKQLPPGRGRAEPSR